MGDHPGWKKFEERIAKVFGGKRRGAATSRNGRGKTDVICDGWAVECKLLARPAFSDLLAAASQAEKNGEPGDIPLAVVKRKGDFDKNALVVMRLETFEAWFVSTETAE